MQSARIIWSANTSVERIPFVLLEPWVPTESTPRKVSVDGLTIKPPKVSEELVGRLERAIPTSANFVFKCSKVTPASI